MWDDPPLAPPRPHRLLPGACVDTGGANRATQGGGRRFRGAQGEGTANGGARAARRRRRIPGGGGSRGAEAPGVGGGGAEGGVPGVLGGGARGGTPAQRARACARRTGWGWGVAMCLGWGSNGPSARCGWCDRGGRRSRALVSRAARAWAGFCGAATPRRSRPSRRRRRRRRWWLRRRRGGGAARAPPRAASAGGVPGDRRARGQSAVASPDADGDAPLAAPARGQAGAPPR